MPGPGLKVPGGGWVFGVQTFVEPKCTNACYIDAVTGDAVLLSIISIKIKICKPRGLSISEYKGRYSYISRNKA